MPIRFIKTGTTGIRCTFGRFQGLVKPGLSFYVPLIQQIAIMQNRIFEKSWDVQVRTADKVFPRVDLSLQFQVLPEDSAVAHFTRSTPQDQLVSFVDNTVRSHAAKLSLDELSESQTHLSEAIMQEVGPCMKETGYTLVRALVRDVVPPKDVLTAMNDINASERRKVAIKNDAEANKIKHILEAEADAQRKILQGEGIAGMRNAMMTGWTESISQMAKGLNMNESQVSDFMLSILRLDTLSDIGRKDGTKTLFLPYSLNNETATRVRDGALQAQESM